MFEDLDHERAGFRVMGTPLAELSRDDLERALVFAALEWRRQRAERMDDMLNESKRLIGRRWGQP